MTFHQRARRRLAHTALPVAFACVLMTAQARAQMVDTSASSQRPYRALFGGAVEGIRGNQSLIVSAAGFGGYDDDIFARGSNPNVGQPRVAGTFIGSQASMAYQRKFQSMTLAASGATANRYVTDSGDFVTTFSAANVSLSGTASARTTWQLQQSVGYRPFFTPSVYPPTSAVGPAVGGTPEFSGGFDDPDVAIPDDYTIASDRNGIRLMTLGQLNRQITKRQHLNVRGRYGNTDFGSQDLDSVENNRMMAGVGYAYDVSRYLQAQVGYAYRTYNTTAEGVSAIHNINIGVNFNRPFVMGGGQTVLTVTPGTVLVNREQLNDGDQDAGKFRLRVVGTATLTHTFSRTWQGSVSYLHSVGFIDGFVEPVEGDRVVAALGGLLAPALDLSMTAGYTSGAIGMRERNFDSALASVRLRLALHTNAALFAQTFYYHYSYDEGVGDQVLAAPEMRRLGFRAGLNIWLPILR
ncbi:hypothetical protein TBR22_A24450 [Luteitalea sp. TBR-22]|uniref:hypothetical protein n=1 Tax=Luteitalea sp. TBR-22 TaxID=2802971 RepID=UPI001AF61063|nr:hypothetical protein [Luteitalea sp. TBR-22]BCS33218.1 hypothetical protein TBR22_A24450 [Luteitalea sp. TBR-22]